MCTVMITYDVTVCKRAEVEWRDYCSLHVVTSSVSYYSTHALKNVIFLFYTIKIIMVNRRIWGV